MKIWGLSHLYLYVYVVDNNKDDKSDDDLDKDDDDNDNDDSMRLVPPVPEVTTCADLQNFPQSISFKPLSKWWLCTITYVHLCLQFLNNHDVIIVFKVMVVTVKLSSINHI